MAVQCCNGLLVTVDLSCFEGPQFLYPSTKMELGMAPRAGQLVSHGSRRFCPLQVESVFGGPGLSIHKHLLTLGSQSS